MIKKVSCFCKQLSQAGRQTVYVLLAKLLWVCEDPTLHLYNQHRGNIAHPHCHTHSIATSTSSSVSSGNFFLTRQQSISRANWIRLSPMPLFTRQCSPRITERTGIHISRGELNNIDLCSTFLSGKLTLLTRVYRQSGREVKRNTLGQKVMKTQLVLAIGLLDKSKPVGLRKVSEANAVAEHKNRCSAVWGTALRSPCWQTGVFVLPLKYSIWGTL